MKRLNPNETAWVHYGVLVHGTFDILHVGHIRLFAFAKSLGSPVIASITGDRHVKTLKGETRPVNSEEYRAEMLEALQDVDNVIINDSPDAAELIRNLKPVYYVKGKEHEIIKVERDALDEVNGELRFMDEVSPHSTTSIINAIREIEASS